MSPRAALLANLALLGFLGVCGWLHYSKPLLYYTSLQEDGAIEWASFWSFLLAAIVFVASARGQRRTTEASPWFLVGIGLFCFLVAMEEISWAQRVLGYQPPEYFLAENYQQEINVHNIAGRALRVWTFRAIVFGYGVLLPLLGLSAPARRPLERIGILIPAIELAPSMFAIFWLHLHYPWKFTGEITECALGFAFLWIAIAAGARIAAQARATELRAAWLPLLAVLLGVATARVSEQRGTDDPGLIAMAETETRALAADLLTPSGEDEAEPITRCGLHKRLYTFVQTRKRGRPLADGEFAALVDEGLPEERARYYLDPWNTPYWVRDRCDERESRRVVSVYSFGPNRRRDSSRWEILGDDIGLYVVRRRGP